MFIVICLETNETVESGFENGRAAAERAKALSESTGKKHQPRPAKSDIDWRDRERARFADGTYAKLPWYDDYWYQNAISEKPELAEHFAHVSTDDAGKIAFTENADKGIVDRQTRMKPGRYLTQFFSHVLCDDDIKHLAGKFAGMYEPLELLFANTADEMERVYTNGPNSCMSHAASDYASPFHPVRIYAAGDLAVAYLATADDKGDRSITARALCWPERKKYNRIYGDENRLDAALRAAGYSPGYLDGAKLKKREYDGGYVVPYIDGSCAATDHGKYLTIDRGGEIRCDTTNGLSESGTTCGCCGEAVYDDNRFPVDGELWCEDCYDNNSFYCDYNEERYAGNDYVIMANGEIWSQDAFDRHGFGCEGNGRCYHDDNRVELSDGTVWSQEYFDRHGFVCDECGDAFATDDMHADHTGVCQTCGDDRTPPDDDGDGDGEKVSNVRHIARPGRDEHPSQAELTFPVAWHGAQIGDTVTVRANKSKLVPAGTYEIRDIDAGDNDMPLYVRLPELDTCLWIYAADIVAVNRTETYEIVEAA